MKNPADLLEVCKELIEYIDNGAPAEHVIENMLIRLTHTNAETY